MSNLALKTVATSRLTLVNDVTWCGALRVGILGLVQCHDTAHAHNVISPRA